MDTFAMVPPAVLGDMAMDPPDRLPFLSTTALWSDLPSAGVDDLVATVGPGSGSPLAMVELRQLGGALGRPSPGAEARATLPGELSLLALGHLGPPAPGEGPLRPERPLQGQPPHPARRGELRGAEKDPAHADQPVHPVQAQRSER